MNSNFMKLRFEQTLTHIVKHIIIAMNRSRTVFMVILNLSLAFYFAGSQF